MCGIAGLLEPDRTADGQRAILEKMAAALHHRGPDDHGVFLAAGAGVGLAHARLSILDLSEAGHQPMASASSRFTIAYNGEIYNFEALRRELEGRAGPWRGHSDTEVLLAAIEAWGVEAAVRRLTGMFAFALWDAERQELILARDRLGIKPLYYGFSGGAFLFGSELKALRAHPGFDRPIDRDALALMMRHGVVPAPYSIYEGIHKLQPGRLLRLVANDARPDRIRIDSYWSVDEIVANGQASPYTGGEQEALDHLDNLLRDAVAIRMISDVPLGAFLSGGIDSSLVVALMQAQSDRPVRTFSIGFEEAGYDEAPHAAAIAAHLGTNHTELYVTPEEATEVIPSLPRLFDEPFADASQIPTFLVSRLAREHVTVSLSGDGGDELFAGYKRYAATMALWSKLVLLPAWTRRMIGRGLHATPGWVLDRGLGWMRPIFARYGSVGTPADKLKKLAPIVSNPTFEFLYRDLISHWHSPEQVVLDGRESPTALSEAAYPPGLGEGTRRMMYYDTVGYLPDDILVKVDRASMGVSLEARVPLIDHRVVEFAWRLPHEYRERNGESKWALRKVLERYVPRPLFERPKMGFGLPVDRWLRGPLRDWGESLLAEDRLIREGFFDPALVRQKWTEHVEGRRDWQYALWDVLMFQAWFESQP